MKSIGFRSWKDTFAFVVVKGTIQTPQIVEKKVVKAPGRFTRAMQLAWLRKEIHELLNRHKPDRALIKIQEKNARLKVLERAEFEGVIQEACISHKLKLEPETRLKQQIKAATGYSGQAKYIDRFLKGLVPVSLQKKDYQEACLVALCGLKV